MRGRLALAAALVALAGCGGEDAAPAAPRPTYAQDGTLPGGVRAKHRFDVVIVAIPGMRWDVVFGVPAAETPMPRLAKLAEESAVFDNAAATAGWQLPTYASLLTALVPCEHGILASHRDGSYEEALIPSLVTMPEVLRAQGWSTLAFTTDWRFHVGAGWEQGFERQGHDFLLQGLVAASTEWFRGHAGSPCLQVLALDASYRYGEKPPGDGAAARSRQVARLREVDETLAKLVAALDGRDPTLDTVLCVVGSCGEALGEAAAGGRIGLGNSVRDEAVHVPLVLRARGRVRPGRVAGSCSVMDVMPTILDLAGLPPLVGASGRSLLPLVAAPKDPGRPVGARDAAGALEFFAVRTAGAKFIARRDTRSRTWTEEVYDLRADPHEEHPLPGDRAAAFGDAFLNAVETLRAKLRQVKAFGDGIRPPYTAPESGC